jgi:hypothetical protein
VNGLFRLIEKNEKPGDLQEISAIPGTVSDFFHSKLGILARETLTSKRGDKS